MFKNISINPKLFLFLIPIVVVILLLAIFSYYSVYNPKPFIVGSIKDNTTLELKNFSWTNPRFVSYTLDENKENYTVRFLIFKRNFYLFWEEDKTNSKTTKVKAENLSFFQEELKVILSEDPNKSFDRILIESNYAIEVDLNKVDTNKKEEEERYLPVRRVNSTHYKLDKFKELQPGLMWRAIKPILGEDDLTVSPEDRTEGLFTIAYAIESEKISHVYLTFRGTDPKTLYAAYVPLIDIVLVTKNKQKITVPKIEGVEDENGFKTGKFDFSPLEGQY